MFDGIVLIPGLNGNASLFSHQSAVLGREWPVLIPDVTRYRSIGAMTESVLKHAPERFALVGFSMGGYIALDLMKRAAERVDRLILMDTSARPDTPDRSAQRRSQVELAEREGIARMAELAWPKVVHPARVEDQSLKSTYLRMSEAAGIDNLRQQIEAIVGRADSRPLLGSIKCPTLVMTGEQDLSTPVEVSKELAASIEGAALEILPNCGHLAPLEMPETVTRHLHMFLAGQ